MIHLDLISRAAAADISPGRKPGVDNARPMKSRRDDSPYSRNRSLRMILCSTMSRPPLSLIRAMSSGTFAPL